MAVIVAGGFLLSQRNSGGPSDAAGDTSGPTSLTVGPDNAPHEVVIWEDFLCPYCGELERASRDKLAQAADDGRVRVTYRPFVLLDQIGPYSQTATEVFAATLHTAGPEVAKKLHDALFENQPEESAKDFPTHADLLARAVEAGADRAKVQQALDSGDAEKWANDATQAAADAGVRSTPTVFLDGREVTGRTLGDIVNTLLQAVS